MFVYNKRMFVYDVMNKKVYCVKKKVYCIMIFKSIFGKDGIILYI